MAHRGRESLPISDETIRVSEISADDFLARVYERIVADPGGSDTCIFSFDGIRKVIEGGHVIFKRAAVVNFNGTNWIIALSGEVYEWTDMAKYTSDLMVIRLKPGEREKAEGDGELEMNKLEELVYRKLNQSRSLEDSLLLARKDGTLRDATDSGLMWMVIRDNPYYIARLIKLEEYLELAELTRVAVVTGVQTYNPKAVDGVGKTIVNFLTQLGNPFASEHS